jgi:hypothetical protein
MRLRKPANNKAANPVPEFALLNRTRCLFGGINNVIFSF